METRVQCARRVIGTTWTHPCNRGRRMRALGRMAAWQAWKRVVRRPRTLTVFGDMTFRAYPDSTEAGRFIYFGSLFDYAEMRFMQRFLRPGDGFIDGGAHEGSFTLLAGRLVGPSGRVEAFEPCPVFAERLRLNVRANTLAHVGVHDQAISSRPGVLPLLLKGNASHLAMPGGPVPPVARGMVAVDVVRLADALPDRPWAMGKLDVEGAELDALIGAGHLVTRADPPVWIVELREGCQRRFGRSVAELRAWLHDHGFDLLRYDPDYNLLAPVPDPLPHPANVLAVSREHRAEVEKRLVDGR